MRPINLIVIHCTATGPDADIGRKEIDEWHKARGWSGIGYHFVIRRNGDIEIGRPMDRIGAHAEGYNADSLGLVVVGGVNHRNEPENNFTPYEWTSLTSLCTALQLRYPEAKVLGHYQLPGVNKACPCFDARQWWLDQKETYIDAILSTARG